MVPGTGTAFVEAPQLGRPALELQIPKSKLWEDGALMPTKHILSILELNTLLSLNASKPLQVHQQPTRKTYLPASGWEVAVGHLDGRDALARYRPPASDWDRRCQHSPTTRAAGYTATPPTVEAYYRNPSRRNELASGGFLVIFSVFLIFPSFVSFMSFSCNIHSYLALKNWRNLPLKE